VRERDEPKYELAYADGVDLKTLNEPYFE